MKKRILTCVVAAIIASQVQAAEYRLAFSQAAQLEVFVEHGDGTEWCSASLKLRFQDNGAADASILEQMMPRIGALIDRECPAAKNAYWYSISGNGNKLLDGQIAQANGWQFSVTHDELVAETTTQQTEEVRVEKTASAFETDVSASSGSPVSSKPAVHTSAKDSLETVIQLTETAEQQIAEVAAETFEIIAMDETAENPLETVIEEKVQAKQTPSILFSVGDWMPRGSVDALADYTFTQPLVDQQGCVFNTNLSFNVPQEFILNQSTGITCDQNKLAQGLGQWQISRSDGVNLGRVEAFFKDGQAFQNIRPDFSIQHIEANKFIYVYLGSDATREVHFLAEGTYNNSAATWNLERPRLLALTEKIDIFRDAGQIQAVIQQGSEKLAPLLDDRSSVITFVALNDPHAWFSGNHHTQNENLLYSITLNKPYRQEQFVFNLEQGKNHLFEREFQQALATQREQERLEQQRIQKEAQEKLERQYAAQREAQRQHQALTQFEHLNQQSDSQRIHNWVKEVEFDIFGGDYVHLMKGGQIEYRQIIQVGRKAQDGEWNVEYPYSAVLLTSDDLKSGWYQFTGVLTLDTSRRDKDGLPLSVMTPQMLSQCADSSCLDQFNALQIMRSHLGDANWSPESAKSVIARFESGEY